MHDIQVTIIQYIYFQAKFIKHYHSTVLLQTLATAFIRVQG